ncbi:transglycosylase [Roseobacter denitrificans]|uniref:Transglycosylase SLT domain protein n=1 Tax=Roseobacter denitrificans (strain ATCC 33942 / OCh 114) TaxID=375451 RepID=Q16DR1_ROSDO|nr:transglycosylase SLT domain-containing protein [Roseobacter denitrificans]ABG29882.1 transglycosylase SLT domain protein [Roseobacter denitrificans OCh 114]AVL53098.1 transglycosylase [Roseobacter denitrificans]SFG25295.1 Transglycosylase SLT domain-containing protein [Roseobacter denitrificans OCh 114]
MHNCKRFVYLFWVFLSSGFAFEAEASTQNSAARHVCDQAAVQAARSSDVPLSVLKAIARTESGITVDDQFAPWPWTVNSEGRGVRFSSAEEAIEYVGLNRQRGVSNIDIGCFQINYKWHGANFSSVQEMFNPYKNALYAANFLTSLYNEFEDWTKAAGAYHSRNTEHSDLYLAKYIPILEQLDQTGRLSGAQKQSVTKANSFPLLIGQPADSTRGSLFPLAASSRGNLLVSSGRKN